MRNCILVLFSVIALFYGVAYAAGSSTTITYSAESQPVKVIYIDWVSDDTTGAVSGSTKRINGRIVKVVTDPSATAPTALYDITITDDEGIDVIQGLGANRSATVTEEVSVVYTGTSNNVYVNDILTINVTNAGNSKQGQIIIYYVGA
ncbi:MAG: hypothetical protein OEY10_00445 [Nitrosopumilus sp.]|nr:hypothetical protein [Nitrosopumilus sp.]